MSTDAMRAAALKIVAAYDAYRHRGMAPAPGEYAGVVAAIEEARAALAQPVSAKSAGWTDADSDAARLALELECLLSDKDVPMPALSRWWNSAHEALELHRARMRATPPASAERVPLTDEAAPVATDARSMLEFLSARFKHAGVSEAVAESYARDIDAILAAEANPTRVPLTDEQLTDIWNASLLKPQSVPAFARAIERAHGITGETE